MLEEDSVFETQILEAKHLAEGVCVRDQRSWDGVNRKQPGLGSGRRLLARLSQAQNLSPSCCSIAGRRAGWGRSRAARSSERTAALS